MKLPIPYPHILKWTDEQLVQSLLKFEKLPTVELLYGKLYPMFKSLYKRYVTGCAEVIDFIHDIYVDIIRPRAIGNRCKLQTFNYRCSLCNWIGVIAIRYCYAQFKKQIPTEDFSDNDGVSISDSSVFMDMGKLNREDVDVMLRMMPNTRYRELIRFRYLEGLSNEETAEKLGMDMPNYYNKHRLAKLQYIQMFLKEMSK